VLVVSLYGVINQTRIGYDDYVDYVDKHDDSYNVYIRPNITIPTNTRIDSFQLVDLDGNNRTDLIYIDRADLENRSMYIEYNIDWSKGHLNFNRKIEVGAGAGGTLDDSVRVTDLNNDNRLDIVVVNEGYRFEMASLMIFYQTNESRIMDTPDFHYFFDDLSVDYQIMDLNNDSYPDIVVSVVNIGFHFFYSTNGSFSYENIPLIENNDKWEWGALFDDHFGLFDFNGDGNIDLIHTTSYNEEEKRYIYYLEHHNQSVSIIGNDTNIIPGIYVRGLDVFDVGSDAIGDVFISYPSKVEIYMDTNEGNFNWTPTYTILIPGDVKYLHLDNRQPGSSILYILNPKPMTFIYYLTLNSTPVINVSLYVNLVGNSTLYNYPLSMKLNDVNGDGLTDVVVYRDDKGNIKDSAFEIYYQADDSDENGMPDNYDAYLQERYGNTA